MCLSCYYYYNTKQINSICQKIICAWQVNYQTVRACLNSSGLFKSPASVPVGRGANNSCTAGKFWNLKCRGSHRALVAVTVLAVDLHWHSQGGWYCAKGGGASKLLTAGPPLSSYSMAGFFYCMFSCENRASSRGAVVGLTPPLAPLWQCVQPSMFAI